MTGVAVQLANGVRVRALPSHPYVAAYVPAGRRFFWIGADAFEDDGAGALRLVSDLDVETLASLSAIGLIHDKEEPHGP